MKLPNGNRADIGTKLEDYSLNYAHRDGRHKARVFESVLGITLGNSYLLKEAILEAVVSSENLISKGHNGFGDLYVLKFPMATERGRASVLTAWIIRDGEDFPRLTTCFIV